MATQLERERVAESTAAYHDRQYRRLVVMLLYPPKAITRTQYDEIRSRADFHYREEQAANVRLVAIQLEGFDARDLVRLCRRAA